jgi:hypothetical protein
MDHTYAVCLSERLSWRADGWSVARYTGQRPLAAAWGFTCGLGYFSFFEHLRRYRLGEIDPAPIPTGVVLMIKGVGVLLAIVARSDSPGHGSGWLFRFAGVTLKRRFDLRGHSGCFGLSG